MIGGTVDGNIAGASLKESSLSTLGNSIVGILGVGLGSQLLGMFGAADTGVAGGLDIGSIKQRREV